MSQESEEKKLEKPKRRRRILRWLAFVVLILLIGIPLLVQIPWVQQWGMKRVSTFVKKKTGADLSFSHFSLDPVRQLVFDDLLLVQEMDTLLEAVNLEVHFGKPLHSLFQRKMFLSDVKLRGVYFHLLRYEDGKRSNIGDFIDGFRGESKGASGPAGRPMHFELSNLSLEDVHFYHENRFKNNYENYRIDKISVVMDKIDMECREIVIDEVRLTRPDVEILQYVGTQDGPDKIEPDFPLIFMLKDVYLEDGKFYMSNERAKSKISMPGRMDYSDFGLSDIQVHLEDFTIHYWKFGGSIDMLSLKAETGYDLELTTDYSTVTCFQTALNGVEIKGEDMNLGPQIVLNYNGYKSFRNITQRIFLDANLSDSWVRIDDLMHFIPGLARNDLFLHNQDRVLHYNGRLRGKFDALRGTKVQMSLDELMYYEGDFSTRNLTTDLPELFNLTMDKMITSSDNLMAISPTLQIPSNFRRLGDIELRGYFDGFSKDFVISGVGNTSIGAYRLDMRLDTKKGAREANYSGSLEVYDFELQKWTQNERFGDVSFRTEVKDGKGLTLQSVEAELKASIGYLEYNDYTYQDIEAEGIFRQNLFNGSLDIEDPFANLSFAGIVDYLREQPKLDFQAEVRRLDLNALNFVDYPLAFAGDLEMDLIGDDLDEVVGYVEGRNLEVDQRRDTFFLDELSVKLAFEGNDRIAVAQSDMGDLKVNGDFKLSQLAQDLKYNLKRQYPEYFGMMGLQLPDTVVSEAFFNFSVEFDDTEYLTGLFGAPNLRFYGLEADGVWDNREAGSTISIEWDSLALRTVSYQDVQITQAGLGGENVVGVYVGDIRLGSRSITPLEIDADMGREEILFSLETKRVSDVFPMLDMLGSLQVVPDGMQLHLDRIFDRRELWDLNPSNQIALIAKSWEVSDMEISKEDKRFFLRKQSDENNVEAVVEGIDLSVLNAIVGMEAFDFDGVGELHAHIDDIDDISVLEVNLLCDSLYVNGDLYGEWSTLAQWYSLDRTVGLNSTLSMDSSNLQIDGVVRTSPVTSDDPIHYDFQIFGEQLSLKLLEYLIPNSIKETRGDFDIDLRLSDDQGLPIPEGTMVINEGYTLVDYLKVGYSFSDQTVRIDENMIDASGALLTDRFGNVARVKGGIRHRHFGQLRMDASLESDKLLVLETRKGDNRLYYGTAIGSVVGQFSGPLDAIDMKIDGATLAGSDITLPLGNRGVENLSENRFYRFVDEQGEEDIDSLELAGRPQGMQVSMNIELTNAAQLRIVFDERTGDILEGNGEGNLNIELARNGDFEVFGDYRITSGDYLFTKSFINKRFAAVPGGMIRWSGDPINANISLDAKYDNLSTSLGPFLQDYLDLSSEETKRQAQNRTPVDLTLQLRGLLLTPDISFDLAFPDLTGELRSLADSRLRVLKADKDALNQQVGALIISKSFIPTNPSGGAYASNLAASSSFNTVSEFLSNQISVLISSLLSEAVTDVDFISNLDFQFDVSNYQVLEDVQTNDDNVFQNSEILINLQPSFLDNRLVFDAGANIVNNSPISSGTFVGEDLMIEYLLSEDGKIKLRAFQRSEEAVNGRIRRFGVGLYYRTEFNSLSDLFSRANKKNR